jgi:hypothetical protein
MNDQALRRGDVVEVRSAAEILGTLDENGDLDATPFMPEMIPYCGKRFTVDRRAEKLCDTINASQTSRRLPNAVLLDDVRCDGSGHAGCQAECRFYWEEAWLRRVDPAEPTPVAVDDPAATARLLSLVEGSATRPGTSPVRFRCQATELLASTEQLSTTDPKPYLREYRSGNVPLGRFIRVMARASVMQPMKKLGWLPMPHLKGSSTTSPAAERLDLQPGEWVRVKSREQVRETLTVKGTNRGLWFDREMMPFCGRTMQVRQRVTQIINERTGEMIHFTNDCIMLEHAVCSGDRSPGRWFCAREIYPYFRECWLERVETPETR